MAAPNPAIPPRALLATPSHVPERPDPKRCDQLPSASANAPIPTPSTSPTLAKVSASAMRPLEATEAQLMSATIQMAASTVNVNPPRLNGPPHGTTPTCQRSKAPPRATFMKMARPTASAACDPARATVNATQPYMKPTKRP